MLRHDRDDGVDAPSNVLTAEIEGRLTPERLAQDHGRIHVGIFDRLTKGNQKGTKGHQREPKVTEGNQRSRIKVTRRTEGRKNAK